MSFHYDSHDDNGTERNIRTDQETISAVTFLLRLFQHIQEPRFHCVRYYGVYSTVIQASDLTKKILKAGTSYLYDPQQHDYRQEHCHYRGAMKYVFHVDPLACPICKKDMKLILYEINGNICSNVRIRVKGKKYIPRHKTTTDE